MNAIWNVSRRVKAVAAVGAFALVGGFGALNASASVMFDLIATGGNGATVSNGGKTVVIDSTVANPTITLQLDAVFPNADANQTNDGLTQAVGSIVSGFGGSASILGNMTAANVSPFLGVGTTSGSQVGPAGDKNIGSDTTPGTAAADGTEFQADSNTGTPVLGSGAAGALTQIFGTATFSITSNGAGQTVLQYIPHTTALTGTQSHIQQFESDGTQSFVNGNSASVTMGTGITVTETPEPGTLALVGLGAVGLLLRRRRTC